MGSFAAGRAALLALTLAAGAMAVTPAPAQPAQGKPLVGDVARGRLTYGRRCSGCHSMVLNRSGPRHLKVFGKPAASAPDYEYSDALRRSGIVWNERTLDLWLKDPEALVPGNYMGYAVGSARDRADIIAYLKFQSRPQR